MATQTQVFSFPQTSIPTGTFQIPPSDLGAVSFTSLILSLARCTAATPQFWPNAATGLDMALEVSYDGGSTWEPGGAITGATGGIETTKIGENPTASFTFSYPTQPNQVRGTLTVTNGPLVTQGSVSVF